MFLRCFRLTTLKFLIFAISSAAAARCRLLRAAGERYAAFFFTRAITLIRYAWRAYAYAEFTLLRKSVVDA